MFLYYTTLLHLLVLCTNSNTHYNSLVLIATSTSILHHYDENNYLYYVIDYSIAGIWSIVDAYYLHYTIYLNLLTLIINKLTIHEYHGYWHIFNAVKSIIVSYMIFG
jgi:hypothetical protein